MWTRDDLRDQVLRKLDEVGESATEDRVEDALNHAVIQRLGSRKWPFLLWPAEVTITTVAAQQTYTLHSLFGQFHSITIDDEELVGPGNPSNYRELSADKYHFEFVETSPLKAQPATASRLTVVSSSASDNTSAKSLVIRGVGTDGEELTETLQPSGTSAATTTGTFARVLNLTKSAAWSGTLTLTDAAATTLLTLSSSEAGKQFPQIRLLADPGAGCSIVYRFYRKPRIMSLGGDLPEIPFPHSIVLVWDALFTLLPYANDVVDPSILTLWKSQRDEAEADFWASAAKSGPRFVRDLNVLA